MRFSQCSWECKMNYIHIQITCHDLKSCLTRTTEACFIMSMPNKASRNSEILSWNTNNSKATVRWAAANESSVFKAQLVSGFMLHVFRPLARFTLCMYDFQNKIWNRWGGVSFNLPFSLHCAHVKATVKQSQSRPNPNLSLVKTLHFLFLQSSQRCLLRRKVPC